MPERTRDAVPPPLAARASAAAADTAAAARRERVAAACPSRSTAVSARLDTLLQRLGAPDERTGGLRWLVCLGANGDEPVTAVVDELVAHAAALGLRARRDTLAGAERAETPLAAARVAPDEARKATARAAAPADLPPELTVIEAAGTACAADLARLPRAQTAVMIVAEAGWTRRDALDATARRMCELGWADVGVVVYAPTPYWPAWARWLFARLTARRGARTA